jgi:glutamate N-acetyltransferase/amino-acid N-acetyltransferase
VFRRGTPLPFDAEALSESLRSRRAVDLRLTLESGEGTARFWTCDLTADYVRLNADYTT